MASSLKGRHEEAATSSSGGFSWIAAVSLIMNGVLLALLLSHMRARHEVAAPGAASDWAKAKAACPAVPAPRALDEEQTEGTEADASPRGKLELLFSRPVAKIHMRDLLPADELSALNQRLVEAFFQMQKDAPVHRHDNDGLYWWSRQHCRDCFSRVAGFELINSTAQQLADSLLGELGLDDLVRSRDHRLAEVWGAALSSGMGHSLHVHYGRLLAGVYYACVPANASGGELHFQTPDRGLTDGVLYAPVEGELVIFAADLPHGVWPFLPQQSHEQRVAISFNFPGSSENLHQGNPFLFDL